jgi:hypothetical protein
LTTLTAVSIIIAGAVRRVQQLLPNAPLRGRVAKTLAEWPSVMFAVRLDQHVRWSTGSSRARGCEKFADEVVMKLCHNSAQRMNGYSVVRVHSIRQQ